MTRRLMRSACAALLAAITASAPATAAAHNFLWKATSTSGTVYLVGSVHLLSSDYYPLNPAFDAAFKDSTTLVEEVDMDQMLSPDAQLHMLTRGMLPAGQTVDKVVSPATMALVTKTTEDLGLPVGPLKQFKPWMLALTIAGLEWQKAGFDPDLGLDKHFFDQAKAEGKSVQGLETLDYQIDRFDELPMSEQDQFLAESLNDTELEDVKPLADAWKAGDGPAVEHIVLDDLKSDPNLYQRLLVERNLNWLPKIEALFKSSGHALVVVGAAHLVGADGLIELLKAKGYRIEQL